MWDWIDQIEDDLTFGLIFLVFLGSIGMIIGSIANHDSPLLTALPVIILLIAGWACFIDYPKRTRNRKHARELRKEAKELRNQEAQKQERLVWRSGSFRPRPSVRRHYSPPQSSYEPEIIEHVPPPPSQKPLITSPKEAPALPDKPDEIIL
jgi:hypothetical protein